VLAHVPSHHDHRIGEWIGIRAQVDHVVTFNRACPPGKGGMCDLPCAVPCGEPCEGSSPEPRELTVAFVPGAARPPAGNTATLPT
jgi:iron(III) transport system ATP-binding protein